jgi:anti-sigma factor RsiW
MSCETIRSRLAGYLDGTLPEAEARSHVAEHLSHCADCREELQSYSRLSQLMSRVQPVAPPEDLAVRIRIAVAKARAELHPARRWQRLRDKLDIVLENILQPLALPATGGFISAIVVFALVLPFYARVGPLSAAADTLPAALFQPARLETLAGFSVSALDSTQADMLLVEATVGADGSVMDYRILAGPDGPQVRRQLDQILMFSRFRPSTSFGRPLSGGHVVMSFSAVSIRG